MAEENEKVGTKSEVPQKKKKGVGRWIGLSAVAVLILVVSGLMIYASGYDGIYPNTYIGECNVSGKTAEEALKILNETYFQEKLAGGVIPLSCQEKKVDLSLDELKVSFDNQASVDAAMKESSHGTVLSKTWAMAKQLFVRTQINPMISYDKEKLEQTLLQVAGEYEIDPVNYTYEIQKNQVVLYGKKDGKKVDRAKFVKDVENRISTGDFSDMAVELMDITPEELNFKEFYKWLTSPAENAYYEKGEDGIIKVHSGKLQCEVDEATVKTALKNVDSAPNNKVTFSVTTKEPEHTTEALTNQLYKDVLGKYTTYYSGTAARNNNVQLATSRINGTEMMPGDEFSYDKTILPRTYENGYQAAPVYVGNKVESGLGGGICQPSSTLYCAALYANLEILERHNHSMLVGYMPAGLDATIAEGYLDMRFKNSTNYPIKIEATAQGGELTFNILGYNPENISVELVRNGGGFHYTATRIVYKDGVEISREALDSSIYSPKAEDEDEEKEKKEKEKEEDKEKEAPEATEQPDATTQPQPPEETPPAEVTPAPVPEPAPAPATESAPTPAPAEVGPTGA